MNNYIVLITYIFYVIFSVCIIGGYIFQKLHAFSDASNKVNGECIYIRSINQAGKISFKLLCGIDRVATLKQIIVSKLKLCGMLILCKLLHQDRSTLYMSFDKTVLWTDSTIVLSWLEMSSKIKTFVANTFSEII